jgi:phosphoserine phosphatase RsbU/P
MEMATAAALQKNYFPAPDFLGSSYDIATFYHSADAVGGDWYTYYLYNNDYLYVHIGDVTGHGTSAALLASYAKGATDMIRHEYTKKNATFIPLEVIHTNLNSVLSMAEDCAALMTMISVMINLKTGECFCLNSGHRPVLVTDHSESQNNVVSITSKTPFILGFREFPTAVMAGKKILQEKDILLLYSDGLIDVPVSRGIRCNERILKKLLADNHEKTAGELRQLIASTLNIAKTKPTDHFIDDVTFIVVRLKLGPRATAAAS